MRSASKIDFTFNWFYIDDKHIAYFNSGSNPMRAASTDPHLPVKSNLEWQGCEPGDPDRSTATPSSQAPAGRSTSAT